MTERPTTGESPLIGTTAKVTTKASASGPRKVKLVLQAISPLSVMKLSFLLSVALGIGMVVATAAIWLALDSMGVFVRINDLVQKFVGDVISFDLLQYVAFSNVMSVSMILAVADIVILTALCTIGALLYNVIAKAVGGVHVTLTDD